MKLVRRFSRSILGIYEAEDGDPVAFTVAERELDGALVRFPSRTFPSTELVPLEEPFHLVVIPLHLHEEAREIGWTDEEILEAVGHLALNEFQSLIASAAALPKDQATPRVLPSAA